MATNPPLGDAANTLIIELASGTVAIDLAPELAPDTVERVKTLAAQGEYDDVAFHRVIPGFVAQTGDVQFGDLADGYDPDRVGTGGSSLPDLPLEPSDEPFVRGTVGMARASDPDSGNSQFFIVYDDATFLDGDYTLFGEVIDGMQYVDTVKVGVPPNGEVQGTPDTMLAVYMADEAAPGLTSVGTGERDRFLGGGEDEAFYGLSGNDTAKSKGGADLLLLGAGADVAKSGAGRDAVAGGDGKDEIYSGKGHDRVDGGAGRDRIEAGAGRDTVTGSGGDDVIKGGGGRDLLVGGTGDDRLSGGKGGDVFLFAIPEFGEDRITDTFVVGEDLIDFRGSGYAREDAEITRDGDTVVIAFGKGVSVTVLDGADIIGQEDDALLF